MKFTNDRACAEKLDQNDPLAGLRDQFHFPIVNGKETPLYFAGNSLGLQPKRAKGYVETELEDWARLGVEGHLHARNPWLPYHELVTEPMARVVGAKPREVVVMNTLTVNLHLMMISFYRPTSTRYKIMMESGAFPSDQYAVASQARLHAESVGFDANSAIIELKPRPGEQTLRPSDILENIEREGTKVALILLGNSNYLTGQAFNLSAISEVGHRQGCKVGFDVAHGAGNLVLNLHDSNCDFAVWCSYKYLNGGPGTLAGCFVHERHLNWKQEPRLEGWWGHNKQTRFEMPSQFDPIPTAEAWQLSNPPILQLAAMRASLDIFDQTGMESIRAKSELLTAYLEYLVGPQFEQITPRDVNQRGAQLSLKIPHDPKTFVENLNHRGVIADFREPNIVRFAPMPLYTRFIDVYHLSEVLNRAGA